MHKEGKKISTNYVWLLYVILFLNSFDMHAQLPLLAPYAASLGAAAMLIGLLLGAYSLSNLVGNLLAGPLLDQYSKKGFIVTGLLLACLLLIAQGYVDEAEELLPLRLVYGFVMAFVTPACFAMLGQIGQTSVEQGKVMAVNGIGLTLASITAPVASGILASAYGYATSFVLFGMIMLLACLLAWMFLPASPKKHAPLTPERTNAAPQVFNSMLLVVGNKQLALACIAGFVLMYAQGTILYEIPLWIHSQQLDPQVTGRLFGFMGVGSLLVLSQFWLQRINAIYRIVAGLFLLGLVCYAIAVGSKLPMSLLLFLKGTCSGLLYPAMATTLTQYSPKGSYGSAFSVFSAVLSVGAMVSPAVAGLCQDLHVSFFLAFLVVTTGSIICFHFHFTQKKNRAIHPVQLR